MATTRGPRSIRELFEPTGIPMVVHPRHEDVKWSKLLLNMLGNASCAILDLPTAAVFGDAACSASSSEHSARR